WVRPVASSESTPCWLGGVPNRCFGSAACRGGPLWPSLVGSLAHHRVRGGHRGPPLQASRLPMKTRYPILSPGCARVPSGSRALGVMAKAPQPGHVKTRLVPPLTLNEAAELSICLLRDTVANIADVAAREEADCLAVYTPAGSGPAFDGLLPAGFSLLSQRGNSLGERLLNATADLLGLGYESVCLINADSPTLPRDMLPSALRAADP